MDEAENTAPAPAVPSAYADPTDPPGPGQEALHHAGDSAIEREGVTFPPDSVVIVPEAVAYKLAGRDNLRIVAETAETWPHYMGMRVRARQAP